MLPSTSQSNPFSWSSFSAVSRSLITFLRAILLARLLSVEEFGIFASVKAVQVITLVLAQYGLNAAFISLRPRILSEHQTQIHSFFLMRVGMVTIWLCLALSACLYLDISATHRIYFLSIVGSAWIASFCDAPRLWHIRSLSHARVAQLDVISLTMGTLASILIALVYRNGVALLAQEFVQAVVLTCAWYFYRPTWRPTRAYLNYSVETISYFWQYGSKNIIADMSQQLIGRLDDYWLALVGGDILLGYYTRAYSLARLPGFVMSQSIKSVTMAIYVKLTDDKIKLSEFFYRINQLQLFLAASIVGVLYIIAPSFIKILLGEKWTPSIPLFRLLLIFAIIESVRVTMSHLFLAMKEPERLARIRLWQLATLIVGLFLASYSDENVALNVAIAVNVTSIASIVLVLIQSRRYLVDHIKMGKFMIPVVMGLTAYFGASLIYQGGSSYIGEIGSSFCYLMLYSILVWLYLQFFDKEYASWAFNLLGQLQSSSKI
ncbi:MAG: oligosaccharide flippase family protein [Candidatus Promineifilaceae bacterium]